jgi:hypothetical protein
VMVGWMGGSVRDGLGAAFLLWRLRYRSGLLGIFATRGGGAWACWGAEALAEWRRVGAEWTEKLKRGVSVSRIFGSEVVSLALGSRGWS